MCVLAKKGALMALPSCPPKGKKKKEKKERNSGFFRGGKVVDELMNPSIICSSDPLELQYPPSIWVYGKPRRNKKTKNLDLLHWSQTSFFFKQTSFHHETQTPKLPPSPLATTQVLDRLFAQRRKKKRRRRRKGTFISPDGMAAQKKEYLQL